MIKKYLGVDLGGTFIKLGIVDDEGNVSMRRELPIDRSGKETVMETLMRGIDKLLEDCGCGADAFAGIGISSAGCIDRINGRIAENGGNIPDWSFTEVTGPLTERYGIRATIANDGNCVALAESWTGAAKGVEDVLCVVLGTGVGGGIVSGGRLIEGARGYGGEIGHFPMHTDSAPLTRDDWSSHYETYASTNGLVRTAKAAGLPFSNGREVFNAAEAGDEGALAALDRWISEIAYGIVGFIYVFNPASVIIGGGVSAQDELLIKPLREKLLGLLMHDFLDGLEIKAAELGNNAGMVGAVKYFIDSEAGRRS